MGSDVGCSVLRLIFLIYAILYAHNPAIYVFTPPYNPWYNWKICNIDESNILVDIQLYN